MRLPRKKISVLVGRSGSGKSTLLRSLNRLNDEFPGVLVSGQVELDFGSGPVPVYPEPGRHPMPLAELRRRVGMVFQTPQVFPASVRRNMILPLSVVAGTPRSELEDRMREALQRVELWDEVADRLDVTAESLSGGQQQRLCLARALALDPEILLLDEPTASLDVHAARHVEELLLSLAPHCTVVMVSHSLEQSLRLADTLTVMGNGRVLHQCGEVSTLNREKLESLMTEPDKEDGYAS
ncbi:MAG: phosphate ABC transporter ATP-binding protein [Mailhella sp.]|nr:phosphate ABC transporter ATP-binding protein [Mailhella sp.]